MSSCVSESTTPTSHLDIGDDGTFADPASLASLDAKKVLNSSSHRTETRNCVSASSLNTSEEDDISSPIIHAITSPKSTQLRLSNTQEQTNFFMKEILCEPRFVPLLIGRRGWTVKQIQDTSGAKVDIDQSVNPRRVTITGNAAQVDHAVQLVHDILRYPHAELRIALRWHWPRC